MIITVHILIDPISAAVWPPYNAGGVDMFARLVILAGEVMAIDIRPAGRRGDFSNCMIDFEVARENALAAQRLIADELELLRILDFCKIAAVDGDEVTVFYPENADKLEIIEALHAWRKPVAKEIGFCREVCGTVWRITRAHLVRWRANRRHRKS